MIEGFAVLAVKHFAFPLSRPLQGYEPAVVDNQSAAKDLRLGLLVMPIFGQASTLVTIWTHLSVSI